jgi:predicted transcriptional regulator
MSEAGYVPVGEVMTGVVRTIEAMATVREAIHLMAETRVSSLVIEQRDEHDEFGLLLVSDIAREVIAKNLSIDRVNVYEIMAKPVLTLPARMNIRYAIRMLVRFDLSRALVVDTGRKPVGIVTLRDLVVRHGAG